MDDEREARLLFLTRPSPGTVLVNIQLQGDEGLLRVKITRDHLFNLNSQSADCLLKEWK